MIVVLQAAPSSGIGCLEVSLLLWIAICGGIGMIVGESRNRRWAGFFMGSLLGPIGWIIIALMGTYYPAVCSECRGGVFKGATRCQHCHADLTKQPGGAP